jgi:hypothetical protein
LNWLVLKNYGLVQLMNKTLESDDQERLSKAEALGYYEQLKPL